MAKEIVTIIRDDIDQSEGAETIGFALDGVEYTIDLGEKNAAKLRKVLAEFIAAATPVEVPRGGKAAKKTSASVNSPKDVQAQRAFWMNDEFRAKYELPEPNDRGRIPAVVADAWRAAGSPRL